MSNLRVYHDHLSLACGRPKAPPPVYLVHAGTEHQSFVNHFPFWIINTKVQELNCKVHSMRNAQSVQLLSVAIFAGKEAHPTEDGG